MAAVTLPGPYRLTYRDWLELPDSNLVYEIIDGELFVTPTPAVGHQRIAARIFTALQQHISSGSLGEVLFAPTGVRLSDDSVVEPDLLVVLAAHADRIGEMVVQGAPDLVVEILSPATARRDLGHKRQLYASAGVPEYWIVDPESESVEVLMLESAVYTRSGLYRRQHSLLSPLLPGFELALEPMFRR